MANFGFNEIRIVGSLPSQVTGNATGDEISLSDWALATPRGHKILKNLTVYDTIESAVGDAHLVIGTSGKKDLYQGGYYRPVLSPDEGFQESFSFLDQFCDTELNTALVFGPEDDGLSSVEAAHCDFLLHIPTSIEAPSMNLAMAATLIFYTFQNLNLAYAKQPPQKNSQKLKNPERTLPATASNLESLLRYVLEALRPTQFHKLPDPDSTKARLRRVLRGWKLSQGDLLFVFEVFYQLKCWGQRSFEGRDFLNK
jgi:tRNA C32,U32 (ribose-2'-O)-methylase TrmJ